MLLAWLPAKLGSIGHDSVRSLGWLRAVLALCFLATLLLSPRLWLTAGRDYPLAPIAEGLPQIAYPFDLCLFGAMAVALLGMAFAPRPRPWLIAVLVISAVWLVLDQTRWQPYILTYLTGTVCLLLGQLRSVRTSATEIAYRHMAPFQILLCATWTYSGLHKLNQRYLDVDFPAFVWPIRSALKVSPADAPAFLFWPGIASGVFEAGLGLALLSPRTRRPAVIGLTLMHVFIMLMLVPFGQRNTVVWPWNVAVVAALWILFWPQHEWRLRLLGDRTMPRPLAAACVVAFILFGILPALSFVDRWPASLSFQMYSGKQRHVSICVPHDQRAALPAAALRAERSAGEVSLLLWAMREMNVTPVMDTRVALQIGRSLAMNAPGTDVRVLIGESPDLLTGKRITRTFVITPPEQMARNPRY